MKNLRHLWTTLLVLGTTGGLLADAESPNPPSHTEFTKVKWEMPAPSVVKTLLVTVENDAFQGADRWYSSGLRLDWQTLSLDGFRNSATGWTLGHQIYTPADLSAQPAPANDRPYAGFLYGGWMESDNSCGALTGWGIVAGLTGEVALGEPAQNLYHGAGNAAKPQGWDSQLKTELAASAFYVWDWAAWSARLGDDWDLALETHAAVAVGTLATEIEGGFVARLRYRMEGSYAPTSHRRWGSAAQLNYRLTKGWHGVLFVGADTRAVARNLFLDGNTWVDSPSVDKYPNVRDGFVGAMLGHGRFAVRYTYLWRTREFKGQPERGGWGSLATSWTF